MIIEQAIGIDDSQIINHPQLERPVHRDCVDNFLNLKQAAKQQGFDLRLASGHRGFQRQLELWNNKAYGKSVILNDAEQVIDCTEYSELDTLVAICRWSAIPGASRHHWGTDIDIYEANALGEQPLQLTNHEAKTLFKEFYQ